MTTTPEEALAATSALSTVVYEARDGGHTIITRDRYSGLLGAIADLTTHEVVLIDGLIDTETEIG